MGNTTKANWSLYKDGEEATSAIVGYEGDTNRVMRYKFVTGEKGASHIYVEFGHTYFLNGNTKQAINWYIGTDPDSHKNAGAGSTAMGTLAFDSLYHTAEIEADITLLPNTTYYLWLFPSVSTYSYYEINTGDADNTLTMSGAAGLVYIDSGSTMEAYQVFKDNGLDWDLLLPFRDNGLDWDLLA